MKTIEGNIVDVFNKRIFSGKLSIENGRIKKIEECDVSANNYIIPGFVDAHVHIESSMLVPSEFAKLAVVHGTVGTISDPHEIGNVLGKRGVEFMIENGLKTPLKFHFGAPSCVPATSFETAGATIDLKDIEEIFKLPRVTYLAEMMNFPGVLSRDSLVMDKIKLAHSLGKQVDGHAPGLMGEEAKKYIDAGISTDHECFTLEEAKNKLSHGMKILIREGSAAKNFEALWSLIDIAPDKVMLCSDDKHPDDLVEGHINKLASRAVKKGLDLFNVLKAACINPVLHYNMDVGLLRTDDPADFSLVENLEDFNVLQTYINGELTADAGKHLLKDVSVELLNNFNCDLIKKNQLEVSMSDASEINVMNVEDGQLITTRSQELIEPHNGKLESSVENDILKMAVINRYQNADPAVAFVKNFGLKKGAIASCVAHDSHNIIAVGTNDDDLAKAINLVIENNGGISCASHQLQKVLALPIAGIMTDKNGIDTAAAYTELDRLAKEWGSKLNAPFMTLSFCALLVIPSIKLSDLGLFDAEHFKFMDLINS